MALLTVFFCVAKGNPVIMARPAVSAVFVLLFRYHRGIEHHIELNLKMAYPARVFDTVAPVGKRNRLDPGAGRSPVYKDIPVEFRRGQRGEFPPDRIPCHYRVYKNEQEN